MSLNMIPSETPPGGPKGEGQKLLAIAIVLVALIGSGTALAISFGHHRPKPSACGEINPTRSEHDLPGSRSHFGDRAWYDALNECR